MNDAEFKTLFDEYVAAAIAAKQNNAHHDQLRSIFISFLNKAFKVEHHEIELEKGVKVAKVKGFIDALYLDTIFEFKRDLATERDKGLQELALYLKAEGDDHFGVLTDGLQFELYHLKEGKLAKIDSVSLGKPTTTSQLAFSWFDALLFTQKELTPTAQDIVKRFGDTSAVFNASLRILTQMSGACQGDPTYKVKYSEWDKLLAKAYGHSVARPQLFLRHTYLSTLAKLIAYCALFGGKPKGPELREVLTGKAFTNLSNLAEEDFFCWTLMPPVEKYAVELLQGLAQHLAVYDMSKVDQDLLKELYENLIDDETKHDLGEVYTPDWLVELTLREAGFSKGKSLLDPACGSGTFLFTAINMIRESGLSGDALVTEALGNVVGMDVHPLAVTISKVNYVLALTPDLISHKKTAVLPIYMANSLEGINPAGGQLVTINGAGKDYFHIPTEMVEDPTALDDVIDNMAKHATQEDETALIGFTAYLEKQGLKDMVPWWRNNLKLMRKLVKQGRDTIWSFILKNYYRPAYLHRHPFDVVAGNPPWLSYRYITEPQYQEQVKKLIFTYGLLGKKEAKLFTHMELATLFFAFSVDIYLKKGGTIAFVMPRSVLTGAKQHKRFQGLLQHFELPPCQLTKVLDLGQPSKGGGVSPLFKVPACVLIAEKDGAGDKVVRTVVQGTLPGKNLKWDAAKKHLQTASKAVSFDKLLPPPLSPSPYLKKVKEGATIVPRSFWFVQPVKSPYGMNQQKPSVETDPLAQKSAKKPWQNIHIKGEVEAEFLFATLLGRQLLPFGCTDLSLVVLPIEDSPSGLKVVGSNQALAKGCIGLSEWLTQAEQLWAEQRKEKSPESIYARLDYHHLLVSQHPIGHHTVVYGTAGTNLAAALISPDMLATMDPPVNGFVSDADVYYYQTKNPMEAHYLCAFLNAPIVDAAIKPHQTMGAWGARHIHRRPFEVVPIPVFKPTDEKHKKLAELSIQCHQKVKVLSLKGNSIGQLRGKVRKALATELAQIDDVVKQILNAPL